MKTIIRDTMIEKTMLLDCRTARRIAWAVMAFAAGYFGLHFITLFS
jgi:hypothetical protein